MKGAQQPVEPGREGPVIKCETCGYEGPSSAFHYVGLAEEMGPNTYRQCPECHGLVYCEELELRSSGKKVWGIGGMRGQVFRRRPAQGGTAD